MNATLASAITSYTFFFLTGFFINIGGPVSNAAAAAFGTDTAALGFCFSLFMVGRLLGILGNGALVRKRGINRNLHIRGLALASLLTAAGLILAGRSVNTFAAWIFVSGIAIGGIYSASNMILVDIFEGARRAFHVSMINFFYSLGAVFSPALSGAMLDRGLPWYSPYIVFTVILLIWGGVTASASFAKLFGGSEAGTPGGKLTGPADSAGSADRDQSTRDIPAAAADAAGPERITFPLVLMCLAIVLVIFAEYMTTFWTPIYLREFRGQDALFSGLAVSAFWIAVLIGRFTESMLIARIRPRFYILASGIAAIIALLILPFHASRPAILTASFFAGLTCAGLFPALFTFGAARAEKLKHTFPSLMMVSAATGSFLAMSAGSLIKKAVGMQGVMFAAPVAIALTVVTVFAVVLSDGREQKKSGAY